MEKQMFVKGEDRQELIACYLSGQIEEWAWQEHLAEDYGLRELAYSPHSQYGGHSAR